MPGAGWTTIPTGLSMTMRSSSSKRMSSGMSSGSGAGVLRRRGREQQGVAVLHPRLGLGDGLPIDRCGTGQYQVLDAAAREGGQGPRQHGIEPAAGHAGIGGHRELLVATIGFGILHERSNSDEAPLTPEARAIIARARRSFLFSIGLLIVGFIAIGGALVYRSMNTGEKAPATGSDYVIAALKIPDGAEVISAVAADGKVTRDLQGRADDERPHLRRPHRRDDPGNPGRQRVAQRSCMSRRAARRSETALPSPTGCGVRWPLDLPLARLASSEYFCTRSSSVSSLVGHLALDGIDEPADLGGDVVELFAQMRLLDALAVPVGHHRRLDSQHLGAEPLQLVLDGELFGQQLLALRHWRAATTPAVSARMVVTRPRHRRCGPRRRSARSGASVAASSLRASEARSSAAAAAASAWRLSALSTCVISDRFWVSRKSARLRSASSLPSSTSMSVL